MPDLGAVRSAYTEFTFTVKETLTKGPNIQISTNPFILARWNVNQTLPENNVIPLPTITVQSVLERTSGSGNINFGWIRSDNNGTTWLSQFPTSQGSGESDELNLQAVQSFNENLTDFAVAIWGSASDTVGTVKGGTAFFTIVKQPGTIITRVK